MEQTLIRSQITWLVGAISIAALVYLISPILTPFFVALFIAYVGNPGISYLEKAGVPRWVSMLVGVAIILMLIGLVSLLFLPALKIQLSNYLDRIPTYLDQLRLWTDPLIEKVSTVAAEVTDQDEGGVSSVTDLAQTALPTGVGGQAGAATVDLAKASTAVLIQLVSNIFLIPVIAFYLLRDWNSITRNLKSVLPAAQRETIISNARRVDTVLKSFLYGQLLVMISLGAMYSAGLMAAGLEFGLLIGVVAGILSFVPFLGTAAGLLMASMAMITQADQLIELWKVFLVFGVGQFIEGNILTPKLVGEQLGLHPVIVIFSVLAGGQLFGFSGILLALPVAAVIWVLIKSIAEDG